jgi:aminopeptidase-like protein
VINAIRNHIRASSGHLSSITGAGLRAVLADIAERVPLEIHHVPTGTAVFDWVVPKEWVVREAWLKDPTGQIVADVQRHPLHLLNYSSPMKATMSLDELRPHLFSKPDTPEAIPYRTSYYTPNWGFCITDTVLNTLIDGMYEVCVDTEFIDGVTSYGELVIPGTTSREVLISTHVCHPGTVNDNLSSVALLTELGRQLLSEPPSRHTIRLLFIPGTIGSLCWLSANQKTTNRIDHGWVMTGLGDTGPLMWKRPRRAATAIDHAMTHVLSAGGGHPSSTFIDFYPYGYDERQFCSPGFDLPVGRLSRSMHGEYPEYHTSLDNEQFVHDEQLIESFSVLREVLDVVNRNAYPVNQSPFGEPQLGRRGLYGAIGGAINRQSAEMAMLWVLNLGDGAHSLLDIASKAGLPFAVVADTAEVLTQHGLLSMSATPGN